MRGNVKREMKNRMHRHGSFLEMKVIIQLSGLIWRIEDTDGRQKPVQMHNRPRTMLGLSDYLREVKTQESVGPRTLFGGRYAGST